MQAFLPHRHAGSVGHDADGLRQPALVARLSGLLALGEGGRTAAVEPDDLAYRVCGDSEGVVTREGVCRVLVRMVYCETDHFVRGGGRVPSDEPEPVVEQIVPCAAVLVPVVGALDLEELAEEGDDSLAVVARVALPGFCQVVLGGRGARGEELGHELAAEAIHVVEERLLQLGGASDAVALDRRGRGVHDGVDLRGSPQDEVREFFFREDDCSTKSLVSASESSRTSSLSFLPDARTSLNSATMPTGMAFEWFLPLSVYWRL